MLVELLAEIDSRTREIARGHGDWPCRKGCDSCCRRLAEWPRLTAVEWDLVEAGLAGLSDGVRAEIADRVRQSGVEGRICPFLDRAAGSCLIYEFRPVACRTYGFYVERDRGLYCGAIEEKVNAGEMDEVVWGNAAGVEARLGDEKIGLADWFKGVV